MPFTNLLLSALLLSPRSILAIPMDSDRQHMNLPEHARDWYRQHDQLHGMNAEDSSPISGRPHPFLADPIYHPAPDSPASSGASATTNNPVGVSHRQGWYGDPSNIWDGGLPQTPRELDESDYELLDWIANDFPDTGHTSSPILQKGTAGDVQVPNTAMSNKEIQKKSIDLKRQEQNQKSRQIAGWPEPKSLQEVEHLPLIPNDGTTKRVVRQENQGVRHQINTEIFGGKLKWYDLQDLPRWNKNLHLKHPHYQHSRELPWIRVPAPRNSAAEDIRVHMTNHNFPLSSVVSVRNTPLAHRPFYAFWGIPGKNPVQEKQLFYYGAATIDPSDNDAIDAVLGPLVRAAKQARISHA